VTVVAPPNPLRGLTGGDGDYIKAVIDEIGGPVLLAGHSYGGSVITAAGTADNVAGLVYISGFAPDEGENLTDLQSKFPAPGAIPYFREHPLPNGGKELTLAPEGFHESFCADLPTADAAFYAISQRPLAGVAPTEAAPTPAWRSRPVWAVFGTADRCIGPRRPPLQLRAYRRDGDRDRGGFARCHDLPPQGGSGRRDDRSPHLRRAVGLI
jgi:pimeloyl-ACP methyl ester carboxylesterase